MGKKVGITLVPEGEARKVTHRIDFDGLRAFLVWLGLGFLVHWVFYGEMAWTSAFSYAAVFLWPVFLIWELIVIGFWGAVYLAAIVTACWLGFAAYQAVDRRRKAVLARGRDL